jgi:hypothetical protein
LCNFGSLTEALCANQSDIAVELDPVLECVFHESSGINSGNVAGYCKINNHGAARNTIVRNGDQIRVRVNFVRK